jgi:hypothetical protein
MTRTATCSCGQLRVTVEGEPIRISMCHCLACQRRTGSLFGVQARWEGPNVRVEGEHRDYERISDDGESRTFSFCPECGATVFYKIASSPGTLAVPVGAFADPAFPMPTVQVYEERRHPWVGLPESIEGYAG